MFADGTINWPVQRLRIIPYQKFNGPMNMAIDYCLAQNLTAEADPILRFYGWEPYCLSLGFHQDVNEINLNSVKKNQIDLVRRPTGGSAVFHSEELTYSLIMAVQKIEHQELFRRIHQLIFEALQNLGYDVQLHAQKDNQNYLKKGSATFVCFNRPAFTEIKMNGKKVVGSAQKIYKQSILQHGSILIGKKQFEIVQYLNADQQYKNQVLKRLEKSSTYLSDQTSVAHSPNEIAEAIIDSFQRHGAYYSYFQWLTPDELETSLSYQRLFDLNNPN